MNEAILIYAGRINEYIAARSDSWPTDVPHRSFLYCTDEDECYIFDANAGEWVAVGI